MIFNYRVEIRPKYLVLTDETTGQEIDIPYEHVKKVRAMLEKAKKQEAALQVREWELKDLAEYLTGEAKVFVDDLVLMGVVIPIQKQATIAKNDAR